MRNKILNHDLFIECLKKNKDAEAQRIFCRHDLGHFLDVARIAMILNLKEGTMIDEELIYVTALLHDIGRFKQYEDGTPHEVASAEIAQIILTNCGMEEQKTHVIIDAILNHRTKSVELEQNLRGILYRADKMSRICFACDYRELCDWKEDKKTKILKY